MGDPRHRNFVSDLRRRFGEQVVVDEVVAHLGKALREERDALTLKAEPLATEAGSLTAALKDREYLTTARQSLAAW